MLFGLVHPAIRAAAGVVLLVTGILLHRMVLDVAGAAAIVISAVQWWQRGQRRPGAER